MHVSRRDALLWSIGGSLTGAAAIASNGAAMRSPNETSRQEPKPEASSPGNSSDPVCLTDYEPLARERISDMAYAYIAGAAADEITLRTNRTAFDDILLKQRVLIDVSEIDTRLNVLGESLSFPVMLAPTAAHGLVHDDAEYGTARGASSAGATMIVSSFSTTAIEDITATADASTWFQLYVQSDRAFTKDLIQRAEDAGCRAICVTVDTPVIGTRNREQRAKFSLPPHLKFAHLTELKRPAHWDPASLYAPILEPKLTWDGIDWIRSVSNVPVILKGITAPEDAEIAVREEIAGIVVSNHGARNLDTTPATISALPLVMEKTQGHLPVLLDGGVRRGTDVLKALALGANAVLIGRPYLYGLAVAGDAGVAKIIEILVREFKMAMALTGCTSLDRINRSVLWDST